jgi:hypothetical protein
MPYKKIDSSVYRNRMRALAAPVVILCLAGCSLVSFKSPERPLSSRDLNARILTREYSAHFIASVEQCADGISARETNSTVLTNALRWKIAATSESQRAATRIAPMMGWLDSWTLAVQMQAFLSPNNPGQSLFGMRQADALAVANQLSGEAEALAQRIVAPPDFDRYQRFVDAYAQEHPLEDLEFVRASVVDLWSKQGNPDAKLIDSMGTIPEALADVSSRLQMYSDTLPSLNMWKTQLALQKAGFSSADIRTALKQLDERLQRMSATAEMAPQLVHGAVADVRRSVIDVIDRLDASSAALIEALRSEHAALSADVRTEREALTVAVDEQRKAVTQDVARISDQLVTTAGDQLRHLVREALLLLIALAMVVLGLPFAAGYMVGRARRDHRPA